MDKTLEDALVAAAHHGLTDREVAAAVEAATSARRDVAALPGQVPLTHPGLPGQTLHADAEAVKVYEQSGWAVDADEDELPGQPKGNASRDEWEAYALAHDTIPDELEGLSRDQIRALFLNEEN